MSLESKAMIGCSMNPMRVAVPGFGNVNLPEIPYCFGRKNSTSLSMRYCTVACRCRAMLRMEDRIRRLCSQILATSKDEEIEPLLVELREALRQHIERLRRRLGSYPLLVERRQRKHNSAAE